MGSSPELEEAWLRNCATPEQLEFFLEEGYLIVPNALPPAMLSRVLDATNRVADEERAKAGKQSSDMVAAFRAISRDDAFLDLLDLPATFPLLWDILGWNIQLYISHIIDYPPEPPTVDKRSSSGWHIDGGRPVPELETRPQPRLSLKVGYFLTDTTVPECGAMRIVPRSHKHGAPPPTSARGAPPERRLGEDPPGTIELQVKPGTAVLFDRRLWHSRGYNYSDVTRKVIFIGYSYRWMRGLDYNLFEDELLERCSPIRRQLLGDSVNIKGHWQPTEEDVPLKTFLEERREGGSQLQPESLRSPLIFKDDNPSPFLPYRSTSSKL